MNYKSLFLTLIFLTLTACGSDNNSNNAGNTSLPPVQPPVIQTNKFTTEIPPDLIVLSQGGTGTLKAFIVIDNDIQNRIEMQLDIIDTGTASVSISGLEQTTHDIKIDYEYLLAEIITPVATANKTLDLTAIGANDLTFNVNDYDLNRLDEDEDGINNTLELIAGTDPRVIELFAAILNLSYEFENTFTFSWLDVNGATYYILSEVIEGSTNRTQIGPRIFPGIQRFDHEVSVLAHLNSKFILQSCNDSGCAEDKALNVAGSLEGALVQVTSDQYIEANGSLSGDGNTYAVRTGFVEVSIYVKNNGQWSLQGTVIKSIPDAGFGGLVDNSDQFGVNVILSKDGSTLAVSASIDDTSEPGVNPASLAFGNGGNDSGAVYVFTRSTDQWSEQAYIKASNLAGSNFFGDSIDISDDGSTLAIGAFGDRRTSTGVGAAQQTPTGLVNAGAVYVFNRSNSGVWLQNVYIKASNTDANDRFGSSVSLSGDGLTLAVGAVGEDSVEKGIKDTLLIDDNLAINSGAVYVYLFDGSNWNQQAYIKASNSDAEDGFSLVELSADGNTLAVSALGEDSGSRIDEQNNLALDSGAVYVFERTAAAWTQQDYIKPDNIDAIGSFGSSISLNGLGTLLAIGDPDENSDSAGVGGDSRNKNHNSGALYLFERNVRWDQKNRIKSNNPITGEKFGIGLLTDDGATLIEQNSLLY
ncbi:hypothetical protein MNBD_GAMMA12-2300 [hydrothermal vent metagenome]|uniref:Uncharacterized protein n=1 Tax=hydrothermal vent metagenome TaxID=652676 RepID=A0A3B0YGI7_9ZZZZ